MSGSLDHALIRQLFDELSAALQARGVRGHVYLVGGGRARRRPRRVVDRPSWTGP